MRITSISCALALGLTLASCGDANETEATKLGFADASTMQEVQAKGWHTNAQYVADETARAKGLGFSGMDELVEAETAGFHDPIAFRKSKADVASGGNEPSESQTASAPTGGDLPSDSYTSTSSESAIIEKSTYYNACGYYSAMVGALQLNIGTENAIAQSKENINNMKVFRATAINLLMLTGRSEDNANQYLKDNSHPEREINARSIAVDDTPLLDAIDLCGKRVQSDSKSDNDFRYAFTKAMK